MKTTIPLFFIVSLLSAFAMGQNSATVEKCEENNLLQNSGFEVDEYVDIEMKYPRLVEQGIELLSGDQGLMPEGVTLDESDLWGWPADNGNGFEYIEGKPGEEVHTGGHAIKIISQNGYSPIIIASHLSARGFIPVSESTKHNDQSIHRNVPYKFSYYAKGIGKVMVISYCYDEELKGIYSPPTDPDQIITVEPVIAQVSDIERWEKFEGTIKVLSSRVNLISFVIKVEGEVWLDDVVLLSQEKP